MGKGALRCRWLSREFFIIMKIDPWKEPESTSRFLIIQPSLYMESQLLLLLEIHGSIFDWCHDGEGKLLVFSAQGTCDVQDNANQ